MSKDDLKHRIFNEEDYIKYPKTGNSLNKFLIKHPDGVDIPTISKVLSMTEKEVTQLYEKAVNTLKEWINK